jgi:hypothetical protein
MHLCIGFLYSLLRSARAAALAGHVPSSLGAEIFLEIGIDLVVPGALTEGTARPQPAAHCRGCEPSSAVFTDEYIQNLEITPEKGIDLISRFSFHLNYISYIVYCVHGHEVSQQATARPSDRRYRARYLEGGITA